MCADAGYPAQDVRQEHHRVGRHGPAGRVFDRVTDEAYNELGADYSTRSNPALARCRAVAQLNKLGYNVNLSAAN